jgi:hypothetical protein
MLPEHLNRPFVACSSCFIQLAWPGENLLQRATLFWLHRIKLEAKFTITQGGKYMSHPTLLCLGSGLAPRYRLNTLQALALPQGSHLQFRYEVDLVSKGLHKGLDDRKLNGATVLMGHVDCTASGRQADGRCFIVPYRQAELLDSRRRGSVFLLTLKMFQFSLVTNLDAFQRSLPGDVPRWKQALDGEPVLDLKASRSLKAPGARRCLTCSRQ